MNRHLPKEAEPSSLDDAARAGWLYYVGGMTQDQIARELGVSRQRAQRLVARAISDGLIRVRIDHPISACMDLARALQQRYGLDLCRVAPGLPDGADPLVTVAPVAAAELERIFTTPDPLVVAFGTGRTLRAVIEEMQFVDAAQHRVVSLIGNVAPDGSASFYEVIMRVADKLRAPHYPMAVPVIATDPADRDHYQLLPHVKNTRSLAARADVTVVGIGQMEDDAPLHVDGFISKSELDHLRAAGAAGEIAGRAFDGDGRYIQGGTNLLLTSVQVPVNENPVICIASGERKQPALRAALRGKLITGLITDEHTAVALLSR
jgi:DNA-binding transcriptional regulator LsrR (DeoR family)|tara:strand:+ start:277 stop:1236 length:960 start_codon:yes stop_codon:yes gene_type:complete